MSVRDRQTGRGRLGLALDPSTGLKYAVAAGAVAIALMIRWVLDPVLGTRAPYLPFSLAIILAARVGGRKPALAATALSGFTILYLFLEPRYSLALATAADGAGLALFLVVGVVISLLVGQLREAVISSTRAEESLRRQAQLIDLAHDAVITADANGIITGWSSGATEAYGWTEAEAAGQPIHELLRTKDHLPMAEADRILLREGRWAGELVHTARDGRQIISECRLVLLRDGKGVPVAMLQTDRDVTERKRAEEQLVAEYRKNAAILESISDGFCTFDHEWRYTLVNPAAAKMLGRAPAELLGKAWWEVWPHMTDSPVGAAYRRAAAEKIPVQVEAFYPEPVNRWFDVRCYPSPEGMTLFFTDTTERRQAEERLRQAQKLESIGLLAGGVAHDFNNLLTVIMGSASDAMEECSSCEHSRAILSAAERAAYLTRQLLAYAGKGHTIRKLVDLTELVTHSTELLSASVPKRVNLRFNLTKDLVYLEADPSQIEQILMNLVINAAEAIPLKTDGLIEIATSRSEVTPETARQHSQAYDVAAGRYVCLEVRDNGEGMDEATAARIFDPFFTTKFTGRGLGLAALHGIVRTAKGFVEVRSSPGKGTTFRVFLPASAKVPQVPARPPALPALRGTTTLLVVDDEDMVRKLAAMTLRRYGYEVLEAQNGKQALEVIEGTPAVPSLVLLDLAMPVMGGDELVTILAARYPDMRIVLSSGYPEEEARKTSATESIAGFLQKPYTGAKLAEKVAQVLAGR